MNLNHEVGRLTGIYGLDSLPDPQGINDICSAKAFPARLFRFVKGLDLESSDRDELAKVELAIDKEESVNMIKSILNKYGRKFEKEGDERNIDKVARSIAGCELYRRFKQEERKGKEFN